MSSTPPQCVNDLSEKIKNPRWPSAVKGPKTASFDPTNHVTAPHFDPVHRIQTKFGMDILLDPRNKPAEEFFIFIKIQDGRRWSEI